MEQYLKQHCWRLRPSKRDNSRFQYCFEDSLPRLKILHPFGWQFLRLWNRANFLYQILLSIPWFISRLEKYCRDTVRINKKVKQYVEITRINTIKWSLIVWKLLILEMGWKIISKKLIVYIFYNLTIFILNCLEMQKIINFFWLCYLGNFF